MNNKIKLINDENDPTPGQSKRKKNKELINKSKEREGQKDKIVLSPELFAELIRLFKEHFFIGIVASSANIYRQYIYNWRNAREDFNLAVTHAQDGWIKQQVELLKKYAKDKREKDWRALKYLLSIADKEFNDKKWIREATGEGQVQQLIININQSDLTTSKVEAMKLIGSNRSKEETVSLKIFNVDKEKKKKPGELETPEEVPF